MEAAAHTTITSGTTIVGGVGIRRVLARKEVGAAVGMGQAATPGEQRYC